jgi:capsular exopolysaccharide synthesis family protein
MSGLDWRHETSRQQAPESLSQTGDHGVLCRAGFESFEYWMKAQASIGSDANLASPAGAGRRRRNSAVAKASFPYMSPEQLRGEVTDQPLGINAARGLTTVLSGNAVPESAFIPSPQLPNLWVLPAGPVSPNPSELLGSSRMKHLLGEWVTMFDHVILDVPPVLPVTDVIRISPEAHAVVLVVRSGQTSKAALRRAVTLLAQVNANVIGIVVNALDLKSSDQYYYSDSGYGGYSDADQAEKASA